MVLAKSAAAYSGTPGRRADQELRKKSLEALMGSMRKGANYLDHVALQLKRAVEPA